jgi:hypothetical protein
MEVRNLDASTFNTWFTAYIAGDESGMALAEKRFRPEFHVAFDAWIARSSMSAGSTVAMTAPPARSDGSPPPEP